MADMQFFVIGNFPFTATRTGEASSWKGRIYRTPHNDESAPSSFTLDLHFGDSPTPAHFAIITEDDLRKLLESPHD